MTPPRRARTAQPNASAYTGTSGHSGVVTPAIANTAAGPTACQPDAATTSIPSLRSGSRYCAIHAAPASPASTARGTSCGGSVNSITTCTGAVGSAHPGPISNSTLAVTTYAATHHPSIDHGIDSGGASSTQPIATTRNDPPVRTADHRSRRSGAPCPRRRDSMISAASAAMSGASVELDVSRPHQSALGAVPAYRCRNGST